MKNCIIGFLMGILISILGICVLITLPFKNYRFTEIFAKYLKKFTFELVNGVEPNYNFPRYRSYRSYKTKEDNDDE